MPSDARAQQAREAHRASLDSWWTSEQHRKRRDNLIRELRADDPAVWTYAAIAAAVGCSPELIAAVVKGRVR